MKKQILFAVVLCLGLMFISASVFAEEDHSYDSWFAGFNIGGGVFKVHYEDALTLNSLDLLWPSLIMEVEAGGALADGLLLGGRLAEYILPTLFTAIQPILYYFPIGGLFVKAAPGLLLYPFSYFEESDVAIGFAGMVGVGYAFWRKSSFNITLNLDYSFLYLNPLGIHYFQFSVGFYWF